MTAIHERIVSVEKVHRDALKIKMNGTYAKFIHEGGAFITNGNEILEVFKLNELTDQDLKKARQPDSSLHILRPLNKSSKKKKIARGEVPIKPEFGYRKAKYRGSHRSHTHGAGAKAGYRKYNSFDVKG